MYRCDKYNLLLRQELRRLRDEAQLKDKRIETMDNDLREARRTVEALTKQIDKGREKKSFWSPRKVPACSSLFFRILLT